MKKIVRNIGARFILLFLGFLIGLMGFLMPGRTLRTIETLDLGNWRLGD